MADSRGNAEVINRPEGQGPLAATAKAENLKRRPADEKNPVDGWQGRRPPARCWPRRR